ncbi:hypothetical protein FDECE_302 [Fusarium decemcellulare]|nr:hypothetical protein FDECE_302 [Fusarium decemcellulare]
MYINFCCDGIYGTPLISATLHPAISISHPASALIEFILKEGADPTIPAGLFGYPIISACLSCPTDVIQKLLDSEVEVSVDVSDPLGRKPVHMACYNSLDVPDSEFAVRDLVGRVPLHYAVMSEDVGLVEEVLARSQRAGLNIDVEDHDGWTPLLWAARASRIWNRAVVTHSFTSDVASFLLSRGASPTAKGQGLYREWTVREVAYYHHADNSYSLDDLGQGSDEKNSQPRRRGKTADFRGNETFFCHCSPTFHVSLYTSSCWLLDAIDILIFIMPSNQNVTAPKSQKVAVRNGSGPDATVSVEMRKGQMCRDLGAEVSINFGECKDIAADVKKITTYGAHGALVAAPTKEAYGLVPLLLRPRGALVSLALPKDPSVIAGTAAALVRGNRSNIVGSLVGTEMEVEEALDFTARGLVHPVLTKGSLDEIDKYCDLLAAGRIPGKVVVKVSS